MTLARMTSALPAPARMISAPPAPARMTSARPDAGLTLVRQDAPVSPYEVTGA